MLKQIRDIADDRPVQSLLCFIMEKK